MQYTNKTVMFLRTVYYQSRPTNTCRRRTALNMREWKMERKNREQMAGVENAGVENAGVENAGV